MRNFFFSFYREQGRFTDDVVGFRCDETSFKSASVWRQRVGRIQQISAITCEISSDCRRKKFDMMLDSVFTILQNYIHRGELFD